MAHRVVEGILYSSNNLLERFHQSFFFYLLPTHARYLSIALYMPVVIGCASALALSISASRTARLRVHARPHLGGGVLHRQCARVSLTADTVLGG